MSNKKPGRKKEVWKPDWPVIAVCSAAFVILLVLPVLLGGHREDPYISYKIMWFNFFGHHYGLPPETPKPLFAALCGVIGHGALYPVMCAFTAGVLGLLMMLSRQLGAPWWAGAAAFLLFGTANTTVLPEFVMSAYYPMLYFFLVLLAVYSFIKKWPAAAAVALLGAGLMRPEAWAFAPLLTLYTLFKKERGFSWWLFVPLIAPLAWAWFDLRISGSATYSADVTQDYMASLGMAPVTFAHYWPATVKNVSSSFFWPVHLFGLAGLGYVAFRRRRPEDFLFAALVLLPFFEFWFLSFAKPVIIHVRFLSFPMLVCCLYAVLALAEHLRAPWVLAVSYAVVLCAGFRGTLIKNTQKQIRDDTRIEADRARALVAVKKLEKNAEAILCGRSVGYFSYNLGESVSGKTFMFREVVANSGPLRCIQQGVAVYIDNDLGGADAVFMLLKNPQPHTMGPFAFYPVYKTSGNTAVVYIFKRLPNHPPPESCAGTSTR